MHMSIHEQRFTELIKKWNEKLKKKSDTKEGELQTSVFLHKDERGNLGSENHRARRNEQEPKVESKMKTEQMLPNLSRERTWQRDVKTLPYVGMSLPGQEKIQSNQLSAHESSQSPFSFLMSRQLQHTEPESEVSALIANGSDARCQVLYI